MNVGQLVEALQQFPADLEVTITDGFGFHFYAGDYSVELFENEQGKQVVDIGVGGCEILGEDDE